MWFSLLVILISLACAFTTDHVVEAFVWLFAETINLLAGIMTPNMDQGFRNAQKKACRRLFKSKYKIRSLQSRNLVAAGKIEVQCFDKTGTLTHGHMDFYGVCRFVGPDDDEKGSASSCKTPVDHDGVKGKNFSLKTEKVDSTLLHVGLACCHTVVPVVEKAVNGEVTYLGNALESEMVKHIPIATPARSRAGAEAGAGNTPSRKKLFSVIRQFDFDQATQLQSVVCKVGEKNFAFVKGSFEAVEKLISPAVHHKSKIGGAGTPACASRLAAESRRLAQQGFYVIAMACRPLECFRAAAGLAGTLSREEVEDPLSDWRFLGFVLFRNDLRPDSKDAVLALKDGGIQPVIITGDNCWAARETKTSRAGVVKTTRMSNLEEVSEEFNTDHSMVVGDEGDGDDDETGEQTTFQFAFTEATFRYLLAFPHTAEDYFHDIATRAVLSNVKVSGSSSAIGTTAPQHRIVGMCGDGGNDCGALKQAHFGLALSESNACLVAPFSSPAESVGAVVEVITEGRVCVENCVSIFQYYIAHALTHTITKPILQYWNSYISEYALLWKDLIVLPFMGLVALPSGAPKEM
ncbi:unnamed protein product, partial [Amoebophrya sp. A120]|eukprot:GSA120T00020234001.1